MIGFRMAYGCDGRNTGILPLRQAQGQDDDGGWVGIVAQDDDLRRLEVRG